MEHIKFQIIPWWSKPFFQEWGWFLAFMILPFASYLSLFLLAILLLTDLYQRGNKILTLLYRQGFLLLTLFFCISNVFGINPANSFLQLANFVPYFLMFGALLTHPAFVERPIQKLTTLARILVILSLPISALALLQYIIKIPAIAIHVQDWSIFHWAFKFDVGHRSYAILSHPNILSSYLVVILGLSLGLILQSMQAPTQVFSQSKLVQRLVPTATSLGLVGIFCTGSRNGIIAALCQLLVFGCFARRSRRLVLTGLGVAIAIITAIVVFGVGGRQLSVELMTQDPRVGVWQIAWGMIQQRPLIGWGLGSFGELYVPDSVPGYPYIHHAHNIWLYLASEVGIPVMLGFTWIIGKLYYQGVRALLRKSLPVSHRAILLSYVLAFGSCILFGFFDVPIFDSRINVLNWLMLAGVSVLANAKPEPVALD